MQTYVSVPVPQPLVPTVIHLVDQYLIESGESSDPMSSGWDELDPQFAHYWWETLRPQERKLMRTFIDADGGELEASTLAEKMDISSSDLAGILGPFQRRLNRDGFPVALSSRTESVEGRRVKVLTPDPGALEIFRRLDDGEDSPPPVAVKPIKRRDR